MHTVVIPHDELFFQVQSHSSAHIVNRDSVHLDIERVI